MKNLKKKIIIGIVAALAAGTIAFTMTGCQSGNTVPLANVDISKTMELKDVQSRGLSGLCDFLMGNGCLEYYTGGNNGKYFDMMADVIGAVDGRKYYFNVNDKPVIVELYEYDTTNLNDTAKKIIDEVKATGEYKLQDVNESVKNVKMSPSGKYLYINSVGSETDEHFKNFTDKLNRLIEEYDQNESKIVVPTKQEESELEKIIDEAVSEAAAEDTGSQASSQTASN